MGNHAAARQDVELLGLGRGLPHLGKGSNQSPAIGRPCSMFGPHVSMFLLPNLKKRGQDTKTAVKTIKHLDP